jgi:hypothetical protein
VLNYVVFEEGNGKPPKPLRTIVMNWPSMCKIVVTLKNGLLPVIFIFMCWRKDLRIEHCVPDTVVRKSKVGHLMRAEKACRRSCHWIYIVVNKYNHMSSFLCRR